MPADSGTQTVTLKFFDPANSGLVNTRFKDVRETGIYSGGYLTVVDTSHCLLSTFVAEVTDGTYQVKVATAAAVNIAVALATPYVVIRWAYLGSASLDYASLIAVATPATYDVVVAKCSFSGVSLVGFDYGNATYPRTTPDTHKLHLNVEPTVASELRVRVRAGVIQGFTAATFVPDQLSDLFVVPASNSRIDLLYVDPDSGAVAIDSSGTAAASPVAPAYKGKIVLAEVTIASTSTNITASMIRDTRCFLTRTIDPDGTTLGFNATTGKLERINPSTTWPGFGAVTNLDSLGSTIIQGYSYIANSDGFLSLNVGFSYAYIYAKIATVWTVVAHSAENDGPTGGGSFVSYAVSSGEEVKITYHPSYFSSCWWKPIGTTGRLVRQ